jgi:hypothetical protein
MVNKSASEQHDEKILRLLRAVREEMDTRPESVRTPDYRRARQAVIFAIMWMQSDIRGPGR